MRRAADILIAALGLILCSPLALAQTLPNEHSEKQRRLEKLKGEMEETRARASALQEQQTKIGSELSGMRAKLVRTANQIQETEERTTAIEGRVVELDGKVGQQEAALAARREDIALTLAALQRLSRQPPALVLVRPNEAVTTARSARLLSTVVPALKTDADALKQDLMLLQQLKSELASEQASLQKSLEELERERANMNRLLASREEERRLLDKETAEERARLARYAAEAQSLEAFIREVEAELERRRAAAEDAARRLAKRPDVARPPVKAKPLPKQDFAALEGAMPMPVRGRYIRGFGDPDEAGNAAKGLTIEARPQAQVVAPFDGRIAFAGPFRNYGQILIIAHGEGYHTLLAGMGRVIAVVGQWVVAGEPVGQMGGGSDVGASSPRTELYVELRSDGKPVNPSRWLAARKGKVSG